MIKEAYCSYELSKLLKEKGFEIDTDKDYWKIGEDGVMYFMSSIGAYTSDPNNEYAFYRPANSYPCPTHQMAMEWLREKGIYICPKHCCFCGSKPKDVPYFLWEPRILKLPGSNIIYPQPLDMCKHYNTYEEAVEAALKYSLENLI